LFLALFNASDEREVFGHGGKPERAAFEFEISYSLITNFSRGSIARSPLCCQHRTSAETRREQGVPFFVRAPQI
jgi:hypothetical protein